MAKKVWDQLFDRSGVDRQRLTVTVVSQYIVVWCILSHNVGVSKPRLAGVGDMAQLVNIPSYGGRNPFFSVLHMG